MEEILKKIEEKVIQLAEQKEQIEKEHKDQINKQDEILKPIAEKVMEYQNNIIKRKSEIEKFEEGTGFYQDIKEKILQEMEEHKKLYTEKERIEKEKQELEKNLLKKQEKLKREIDEVKAETISELKEKQKIIDENRKKDFSEVDFDKLKEEKDKLEKEIQLNDTTKEEFLNMSPEDQQKVRKAKENVLNNKRRLNEITPIIDLETILDGDSPKDAYLKISDTIEEINDYLNFEKLDEYKEKINMNIEFRKELEEAQQKKDEREEMINGMSKEEFKDYYLGKNNDDSRSEKNVTSNEQKNEDETKYNQKGEENKNNINPENKTSQRTNRYEISKIWINESTDKIKVFIKDKNGQIKSKELEGKIKAILNNKKDVFKENEIAKKCASITGSKIKGYLLSRKVNPVVVTLMGALDDETAINKYLQSIHTKTEVDFTMVHDLRNSSLSFKNKRLMKRCAKEEEKIGTVVLKDDNKLKLLKAKNKKVIKNEPKKFKEGIKHYTKQLRKNLYKATTSFAERIKVDDDIIENTNKVATNSKENVIEKDQGTER